MLVVDNGSIYTKNLIELLNQKNVSFDVRTPHELGSGTLEYDAVILSGRRKNDRRTNEVNAKIVRHSVENGKKLLGICYGAEILALALGGTIRRSASPRRGQQTVSTSRENPLSRGTMTVFESHGFEISRLPGELVPLAESEDCRYEIVGHVKEPVFGTQFHPEMSPDGHDLIERFCSL